MDRPIFDIELLHMFLGFVWMSIGGAFALSVLSKLSAFWEFADSLRGYSVPARLRRLVAGVVIFAEGAVPAMMLVNGLLAGVALMLASALLIGFSCALIKSILTGMPLTCYCFGRSKVHISWVDVCRNGGLAILAGGGLAMMANGRDEFTSTSTNWAFITDNPGAVLVGMGAGLAFTLIWSRLGEIVALFEVD